MLLLGDQPGVKTEFIDQMVANWRKEKPRASVTSYRGELDHPLVFAREAFEELRKLHGDKAVWKLIEAYPVRVMRVNIDAELPLDVDTP
jgi:molybdenum cofactor cytidylyltransferase